MRVLIGCEKSGVVREAFRRLGHDAWSCDILPAEDESPYHLQCDVLTVLDRGWDIGIFHPECTYLALCQSWRCNRCPERAAKRAAKRAAAVEFARKLWECDIPKIGMENPKSQLSTLLAPKTQTIHPWQFGHEEFKETWLWLKNLPKLIPTDELITPGKYHPDREKWERVWRMPPGKDRKAMRSRTYQGIADAMAEQWGGLA